ncbi:glycosyltransferase [Oxalobacteraceae bacterium R-40]|uniref:Glycosyltransferase n=1 Tax=Keguizhuia sedimenti TaxID=3064264 RepID=A0ABU1BMA5_9BURK|nr:glycosyltransferase [Oxalobacteraceae bacterium R-40]
MKDNIKVAVLLATYNGAKWIEEQIDSILKQIGVDVHIYISDDISTDGTVHEILKIINVAPLQITLLPRNKRFGTAARNFFRLIKEINFAEYDYAFLSDQDDVWNDKKLVSAVNEMKSHNAACYASNLTCIYESGKNRMLKKAYPQTDQDFLFQTASAGCTYGLRKDAALFVQKVLNARDDHYPTFASHDWLIYAITRSYGFRWYIDTCSFIYYRQHENNAFGANSGLHSYFKRMRLLRRGWYRQNILYVSSFCSLNEVQQKNLLRIKRWKLKDRIFLALNANHFRRRPIEKISIAFMLLLGFM